jgi:hypothetical protein
MQHTQTQASSMPLTCTPGDVTDTLLGRTRTCTHLLSSSAKPRGAEAPGQAPSRQHLPQKGPGRGCSERLEGQGTVYPAHSARQQCALASSPGIQGTSLRVEVLLISWRKWRSKGGGGSKA